MKRIRCIPFPTGMALLLLAGLAQMGCSPRTCDSGQAVESIDEQDRLELACELAIIHLEELIANRSKEDNFPTAVLAEANELHEIGKELYLEREYALALEFIEQGIQLVKEAGG